MVLDRQLKPSMFYGVEQGALPGWRFEAGFPRSAIFDVSCKGEPREAHQAFLNRPEGTREFSINLELAIAYNPGYYLSHIARHLWANSTVIRLKVIK